MAAIERIHGFTLRLTKTDKPYPPEARSLFMRAKGLGADTVFLVPHLYGYVDYSDPVTGPKWVVAPPEYHAPPPGYIYPDQRQDLEHPFGNTVSLYHLRYLAHLAEECGLRVGIKPHLDPRDPGSWRGQVVTGHPKWGSREWKAFRSSYREQMLRPFVEILKGLSGQHGAPILCMGCEYYAMTKELGPAWWIDQATWLRSRSGANWSGLLTYAANWGVEMDAEYNRLWMLWKSNLIDFIGIDAYYRMPSLKPGATVDDWLAAWDTPLGPAAWYPTPAGDVLSLAQEVKKQVVFTEAGIGNFWEAPTMPSEPPPPKGDTYRNDGVQADFYRAIHQRFDKEPVSAYAGLVAWEMFTEDMAAADFVSHSITGREAETVAFRDYKEEA